ncbi:GNAT family N-acetyltransferase [Actinomadura parmotrematis]|uniref:GNAT family N-acetyltransferase n=1 Tax=Actinomadura parmotrematis TaxID=2864039 RepID=A0ABS7FVK0_9ACTN|nr:GNAT family protein [Actinomadura parmotrematis]MBW8484210.1 GNAT family N-acetyltransferase [Actinomadura parmotrematis]
MSEAFTGTVLLRGPRVTLRPFGMDDAAAYIEAVRAGEDWMPPNFPRDLDAERLAWWLTHGVNQIQKLGLGIHLAILDESGALAGTIGLYRVDWAQLTCEVGYGLRPGHRGRGHATEALRTVASWALGPCGLHRMELRAIATNTASIAVANRAGFRLEGRARGAERVDGVSHDQDVFAMLSTDPAVTGAAGGLTAAASPGSDPMTSDTTSPAARAAEAGEKTLVLHAGDPAAARAMLPKLPDACFAEVPADLAPVAADAAAHGLAQLVLVAPAGVLATLAEPGGPVRLLGEITADMGGSAAQTEAVTAAATPEDAAALWAEAGLAGPCARELCRRVAGVLDGPVAAQVVLVDGADGRMVGMFGRMARTG